MTSSKKANPREAKLGAAPRGGRRELLSYAEFVKAGRAPTVSMIVFGVVPLMIPTANTCPGVAFSSRYEAKES